MTAKRSEIVNLLWKGQEPFAQPAAFAGRYDPQGWASDNPMLARAIQEVRPEVVVEIGVWKGGSVITMAEEMRRLKIDGAIIAVDTWLGAAEHWRESGYFPHLRIENGYPTLFKTFASNIIEKDLTDLVVPLPLDSLNAASLIAGHGIYPDVVHIDGGHDFHSVTGDLTTWWPLLRPGGALVGDDYHPSGIEVWPEVRAAFHAFFKVESLDHFGGKCFIRKPAEDIVS